MGGNHLSHLPERTWAACLSRSDHPSRRQPQDGRRAYAGGRCGMTAVQPVREAKSQVCRSGAAHSRVPTPLCLGGRAGLCHFVPSEVDSRPKSGPLFMRYCIWISSIPATRVFPHTRHGLPPCFLRRMRKDHGRKRFMTLSRLSWFSSRETVRFYICTHVRSW